MSDEDEARFRIEDQLQYWINRAGFLLRREIGERFSAAKMDLSAEEMALLIQITRRPGQTPSALADATIRDRTTVTRFLDGLSRKGLIARRHDAADRRRVIVDPTDKAMRLLPEILPVVKGLIRDSLRGVPPAEAEIARRVLQRLTDNLLAMRD